MRPSAARCAGISAAPTETTARDGSESTTDNVNARLRGAIERQLDDRWRVRVRAAARLSDDQDGFDAYLRGGRSSLPSRGVDLPFGP